MMQNVVCWPSDSLCLCTHAQGTSISGSFSAVSTPIFASKVSFFHIFRDLEDPHSFAPLRTQNFSIFNRFWYFFGKILENLRFRMIFIVFWCDFNENLSEFHEISRKCWALCKILRIFLKDFLYAESLCTCTRAQGTSTRGRELIWRPVLSLHCINWV